MNTVTKSCLLSSIYSACATDGVRNIFSSEEVKAGEEVKKRRSCSEKEVRSALLHFQVRCSPIEQQLSAILSDSININLIFSYTVKVDLPALRELKMKTNH